MTRLRIGAWDYPSGNRIEVYLTGSLDDPLRELHCEWEDFPLSRRDRRYYQQTVEAQIMGRLCEYLEISPAKAMYVCADWGE